MEPNIRTQIVANHFTLPVPCASLGHPFPGHSLLSDALPITACRGPVSINKRSRVQQLHLATQPQETVNELFKGYAACQDLALAFQRMKLERAKCMLAQLDYADALLSRQRPDARIGASHHQLAHPTWRQVWLLPIAVTAEQLRVGRRYLRVMACCQLTPPKLSACEAGARPVKQVIILG